MATATRGPAAAEARLLAAAQGGDSAAFEQLVHEHRAPLQAYCYRMLGSLQDAEDALQETLLAAWRGLASFEGRSSLRTWLYRIATNACIRLASRRPRRILTPDHGPARTDVHDLGEFVAEPVWLDPFPDVPADLDTDPEARYERSESVELAFVAALQHLPARQRAVLILRDVLAFSAREVAVALDSTVPSVNSALQRARAGVAERVPAASQRDELRRIGEDGERALLVRFVAAWERADVDAIIDLLTSDARFTMPPLPAWFEGLPDIGRFFTERIFATPWRLVPLRISGQLGFACYQGSADGAGYVLHAVNVLTVRDGRIAELDGFLDPTVYGRFGLAEDFAEESARQR